jgi:hypothetical protein
MTLLLSALLIVLGLLLWLTAGILPIVKLSDADATVTLTLENTWMGAITVSRRIVEGVRDARFIQDPNIRRGGQVQIRRTGAWEPLSVGLLPDTPLQAQLAKIIRHFVRHGGPAQLRFPMRSRLNLMIGFAVFFPLGTISIFTAILLLANGG